MKLIVTAIAATALLFGYGRPGIAKSANASDKAQVSSKAQVGKKRVSTKTHARTSAKHMRRGSARNSLAPRVLDYAPGQRMKRPARSGGQGGASEFAPAG